MTTRRGFLAGLVATGLAPRPTWAEAGDPAYLGAARRPDGSYALFGLSAAGEALFDVPLPDRGHAAAAHPHRPEAVAFARRPGTFAVVVDCVTGAVRARLEAAPGRHFYGHGAFSADGALLFTPENDYEAARGVIGVRDTRAGYVRVGEFESGGVGPHEIRLMPDGETLVVANGGIETHPDSGRAKLNIPLMRPNLAYMGLDGRPRETVELPPELHRNSIRHLAVGADGLVGFAMQWQGDLAEAPPLVGLHRRDEAVRLLVAEGAEQRAMEGYAGSIALSPATGQVAISSPRGGRAQFFDTASGRHVGTFLGPDICGLAEAADGVLTSAGSGRVSLAGPEGGRWNRDHRCQWDNHLVALPRTMRV